MTAEADLGIPEVIVRALAYRESLHRFGFSDAQVRIVFGTPVVNYQTEAGQQTVTVQLRRRPNRMLIPADFIITVGHIASSYGADEMKMTVERWNALDRDVRDQLYKRYQPLRDFEALAKAIENKGIELPIAHLVEGVTIAMQGPQGPEDEAN